MKQFEKFWNFDKSKGKTMEFHLSMPMGTMKSLKIDMQYHLKLH
jgi:hypothetical protein